MSGKKIGLDEKYKALGVGPRTTLSINPMQDDLNKIKRNDCCNCSSF
jgi:hypothetical protein